MTAPEVSRFTVGPFQENCYVVMDSKGAEAGVIVDPGDEAERLLASDLAAGSGSKRSWSPTRTSTTSVRLRARTRDRRAGLLPVARARSSGGHRQRRRVVGHGAVRELRRRRASRRRRAARARRSAIEVLFTPGHSPGHLTYAIPEHGDPSQRRRAVPRLGRPRGPARRRLADAACLDRTLIDGYPPQTPSYPGHGPHDARASSAPGIRSCPSSPHVERVSRPRAGHVRHPSRARRASASRSSRPRVRCSRPPATAGSRRRASR